MTPPPMLRAAESQVLSPGDLDPHRPTYHFTPPNGWLNDPNGIVHHDGRWHVYYQHNPEAAQWGSIHWGHASSTDLITWRDEPMALAPTPGSADEHGCFSGSFALVNGTPTLYYTGWQGSVQTQCMATSTDLITWIKHPANPIIAQPPEGVRCDDFRDPYVFKHESTWCMALGASLNHDRGAVLLYQSHDAQTWTYRGVLFEATRSDQGVMWECPNFFPLGDRWVLVVSVWPGLGAQYFVGTFDGQRFKAEREGVIDGDGSAFAHLTATSTDGRALQWAWINEQRHQEHIDAGGWAGALSVPRELWLEEGDLRVRPVAELDTLHATSLHTGPVVLQPDTPLTFDGAHLDLHLRLETAVEHPVHISLLCAPDRSEETLLTFDPNARSLKLHRARSSLDARVTRDAQRVHLALTRGEALDLRVLLDGSVLEVYANGRICLTSRVYPTRSESTGGCITASQPTHATLDLWTMRRGPHFRSAP